jgi:hypothetical protein
MRKPSYNRARGDVELVSECLYRADAVHLDPSSIEFLRESAINTEIRRQKRPGLSTISLEQCGGRSHVFVVVRTKQRAEEPCVASSILALGTESVS